MFNEENENQSSEDDDDDDIFATLGVESSPPSERGSDLLDAFADDDELPETTLSFDAAEVQGEDDDDVDPFDLIGGSEAPKSDGERDSSGDDALAALLDDDDVFIEDEGGESKEEPTKKIDKNDAEQAYRLLLETVWVDNILDPSEVALLQRKRDSLGIEFSTHLEMVRDIITTDVSGNEEALDQDAEALGRSALTIGLSKQEWLKAYEWCEALGCGNAFAHGVWGGSQAELEGEVHELLRPLEKLLRE